MSNESDVMNDNLIEHLSGSHAKISFVEGKPIALVEATSSYIPIEEFKHIFSEIGKLVDSQGISKLIFDKRKLTVFHQPSMEWYYVIWKKDMYEKGLRIHRKILPPEPWFRKSVAIAKDQIGREHNALIIDKLDIKYCETVEEAIEK